MARQNWYFYWQKEGQDPWRESLASDRVKVVSDQQPRYTTVLDLDTLVHEATSREDLINIAYRGPFYIDIDVDPDFGGAAKAIQQMNKCLDKIEAHGVNLNTLRLYASGSKGFHIEMPWETFIVKAPSNGIKKLPLIYKEMVSDFYVDHVDMRVYSARKGRMWRTPNVQRENGKYKVPVSVEEVRSMTAEDYALLVSGPRPLLTPEPAVYVASVGVVFSRAQDKVENMVKAALKAKVDPAVVDKWKRRHPAELQQLLNGENVIEGVGFQKIAVQLGLVSNGFGWTADQLVTAAQGLLENHVSDGSRYNTPAKRERELRRMYDYFVENGHFYEVSMGPIRSMIQISMGDVPEDAQEDIEADEDFYDNLDSGVTCGVRINRFGMFRPTEGGSVRASVIGMEGFDQMVDVTTGEVLGYHADIFVDGRSIGRHNVTMDNFTSKAKLQSWGLKVAGSPVQLTDNQVSGAAEVVRNLVMKKGKKVYAVNKEGLDWIMHPQTGELDTVYVSEDRCLSKGGHTYTLKTYSGETLPMRSDILNAPEIQDTPETREFFEHFFRINTPLILGRMLGWFSACFISQILRHKFNQFPMLQVFGLAGSGKSKTCDLLSRLHFYRKRPPMLMASAVTRFVLRSRLSSSASIPVMLDEFKPSEMGKEQVGMLTNFLRGNYQGTEASVGTVRREQAQSTVDVRENANTAPFCFIGEAMETQSAIVDRCVIVAMGHQDRRGRRDDFNYCYENREVLGSVGKSILGWAFGLDQEAVFTKLREYEAEIEAEFEHFDDKMSRQIYNIAVVKLGLDIFDQALSGAFGSRYQHHLDEMREAIQQSISQIVVKNMSETSKILHVMAYLTAKDQDDQWRMVYGIDYTVQGEKLDIKVQNAYSKYVRYVRSLGQQPLHSSYDRFRIALSNYPGTVDKVCKDNDILRDSIRADVFGLSIPFMDSEGIDDFRSS